MTNVAAITEEVVEGLSVGQFYEDISSYELTDVSADARGRTLDKGLKITKSLLEGQGKTAERPKAVEVILDIEQENWVFMTQPGALRRVVMNVFGNAIKYTHKGSIIVRLESEGLEHEQLNGQEHGRMVTITISDTGQGISSEYLRSRLYTPFAQVSRSFCFPTTLGRLCCIRLLTGWQSGKCFSTRYRSRIINSAQHSDYVGRQCRRPQPGRRRHGGESFSSSHETGPRQ